MTYKSNISESIYIYLYLDIIIYSLIACILSLLFIWLFIKITGIQKVFEFVYENTFEILVIFTESIIVFTTGYIFSNLLDLMEYNMRIINDDRKRLLQQNMDLLNENKNIKLVFQKLIKNMEKEDKEIFLKSF